MALILAKTSLYPLQLLDSPFLPLRYLTGFPALLQTCTVEASWSDNVFTLLMYTGCDNVLIVKYCQGLQQVALQYNDS